MIVDRLVESLKMKLIPSELYKNKSIKPSVVIRLELLLALLRYRKKMQDVLCPKDLTTKTFIKIIDDITKVTIEKELRFNSRIKLDMTKQNGFENIPDILYALRIYLTGDTNSANSIKIIGISDD